MWGGLFHEEYGEDGGGGRRWKCDLASFVDGLERVEMGRRERVFSNSDRGVLSYLMLMVYPVGN